MIRRHLRPDPAVPTPTALLQASPPVVPRLAVVRRWSSLARQSLRLVPLLLLLLLSACQHRPAPALSAAQANRLARDLANERAKALFACEPFADRAAARLAEGRWVWWDRRAYGPVDIEATVDFAADGSARHVEVILLDSRATFEFLKYRIR